MDNAPQKDARQENLDAGVPTQELIAQLYEELRKLAAARMERERKGHTLTATSLVHEVYVRLHADRSHWASKAQFFTAAAEAMKRALIDHARRRNAAKRGGGDAPEPLDGIDIAANTSGVDALNLDRELANLRTLDADAYQVVLLRFFAGLRLVDIAAMLDITERTAKRRWQRARLWLLTRLKPGSLGPEHLPEHGDGE
ncbi:MAG: sigma-70 family RNA polymerase sigma factor [Planctomycetes bacterium]|nr:sigma-70 family RNA polymerase sigma factor [Planctomycetota bacterium]